MKNSSVSGSIQEFLGAEKQGSFKEEGGVSFKRQEFLVKNFRKM